MGITVFDRIEIRTVVECLNHIVFVSMDCFRDGATRFSRIGNDVFAYLMVKCQVGCVSSVYGLPNEAGASRVAFIVRVESNLK